MIHLSEHSTCAFAGDTMMMRICTEDGNELTLMPDEVRKLREAIEAREEARDD